MVTRLRLYYKSPIAALRSTMKIFFNSPDMTSGCCEIFLTIVTALAGNEL